MTIDQCNAAPDILVAGSSRPTATDIRPSTATVPMPHTTLITGTLESVPEAAGNACPPEADAHLQDNMQTLDKREEDADDTAGAMHHDQDAQQQADADVQHVVDNGMAVCDEAVGGVSGALGNQPEAVSEDKGEPVAGQAAPSPHPVDDPLHHAEVDIDKGEHVGPWRTGSLSHDDAQQLQQAVSQAEL